jgi:hypothetical protein
MLYYKHGSCCRASCYVTYMAVNNDSTTQVDPYIFFSCLVVLHSVKLYRGDLAIASMVDNILLLTERADCRYSIQFQVPRDLARVRATSAAKNSNNNITSVKSKHRCIGIVSLWDCCRKGSSFWSPSGPNQYWCSSLTVRSEPWLKLIEQVETYNKLFEWQ